MRKQLFFIGYALALVACNNKAEKNVPEVRYNRPLPQDGKTVAATVVSVAGVLQTPIAALPQPQNKTPQRLNALPTTHDVAAETKAQQTPLTPEQTLVRKVETAMKQALQSVANESANPRLVAGYEFGMSKKTVQEHTGKMMHKGALKRSQQDDNRFVYLYQLPSSDNDKMDTSLDADYISGALYKLSCSVEVRGDNTLAATFKQAKTFLEKLYGKPAFQVTDNRFLWINGRIHIDLYCKHNKVLFVFTDLQEEQPAVPVKCA